MADFYPVLSRAIAGLHDKSPEARRAVYGRAKDVLVAQLRGLDPPVSESDIARQKLALDEAIARIEREHEEAAVPAPQPSPEALPPTPPPTPTPPPPLEPVAFTDSERLPPEPSTQASEEALPAGAAKSGPRDASSRSEAGLDRPRVELTPKKAKPAWPWRNLIVGGGILSAVGAIAAVAFYVNRNEPQSALPDRATAPAPQAPAGPKISERASGDQPAQGQQAMPAAPSNPPPNLAQTPRADVAVAQRAVLYIEPTDGGQQPRAVAGRVSWRVEAQNTGQGRPLETVLRADVEVPDGGLTLIFTIRRNADPAFPASHIIGMRFQRAADDGNGAVREVGVPQFKAEEGERGAPLSAITSALGDNLFVSALSRVPIEVERNLDLIRTRNWIDIPVRFSSGRRGIIAFEKGISGDQRIAEALRAWQ